MRNNSIVLTAEPKGRSCEGIVAGASGYPGMIFQEDPTTTLVGGRYSFKPYDRAADGDRPAGALWVMTEDTLGVGGLTTEYAVGSRGFFYCPLPGDELNVLYADVAGTGDTHAAGELGMVDDGTGKVIATTGTPQSAPFMLMEASAALTADTLLWVRFGGQA